MNIMLPSSILTYIVVWQIHFKVSFPNHKPFTLTVQILQFEYDFAHTLGY